jgi:hypothetical protein
VSRANPGPRASSRWVAPEAAEASGSTQAGRDGVDQHRNPIAEIGVLCSKKLNSGTGSSRYRRCDPSPRESNHSRALLDRRLWAVNAGSAQAPSPTTRQTSPTQIYRSSSSIRGCSLKRVRCPSTAQTPPDCTRLPSTHGHQRRERFEPFEQNFQSLACKVACRLVFARSKSIYEFAHGFLACERAWSRRAQPAKPVLATPLEGCESLPLRRPPLRTRGAERAPLAKPGTGAGAGGGGHIAIRESPRRIEMSVCARIDICAQRGLPPFHPQARRAEHGIWGRRKRERPNDAAGYCRVGLHAGRSTGRCGASRPAC